MTLYRPSFDATTDGDKIKDIATAVKLFSQKHEQDIDALHIYKTFRQKLIQELTYIESNITSSTRAFIEDVYPTILTPDEYHQGTPSEIANNNNNPSQQEHKLTTISDTQQSQQPSTTDIQIRQLPSNQEMEFFDAETPQGTLPIFPHFIHHPNWKKYYQVNITYVQQKLWRKSVQMLQEGWYEYFTPTRLLYSSDKATCKQQIEDRYQNFHTTYYDTLHNNMFMPFELLRKIMKELAHMELKYGASLDTTIFGYIYTSVDNFGRFDETESVIDSEDGEIMGNDAEDDGDDATPDNNTLVKVSNEEYHQHLLQQEKEESRQSIENEVNESANEYTTSAKPSSDKPSQSTIQPTLDTVSESNTIEKEEEDDINTVASDKTSVVKKKNESVQLPPPNTIRYVITWFYTSSDENKRTSELLQKQKASQERTEKQKELMQKAQDELRLFLYSFYEFLKSLDKNLKIITWKGVGPGGKGWYSLPDKLTEFPDEVFKLNKYFDGIRPKQLSGRVFLRLRATTILSEREFIQRVRDWAEFRDANFFKCVLQDETSIQIGWIWYSSNYDNIDLWKKNLTNITGHEWGFRMAACTKSDEKLPWRERAKAIAVYVPLDIWMIDQKEIEKIFAIENKYLYPWTNNTIFCRPEQEVEEAEKGRYTETLQRHQIHSEKLRARIVDYIEVDIDRQLEDRNGKKITLRQIILSIPTTSQLVIYKGGFLFHGINYTQDSSELWFDKTRGPGGSGYVLTYYDDLEGEVSTVCKGLGRMVQSLYGSTLASQCFTRNHFRYNKGWIWHKQLKSFTNPEKAIQKNNFENDSNKAMIALAKEALAKKQTSSTTTATAKANLLHMVEDAASEATNESCLNLKEATMMKQVINPNEDFTMADGGTNKPAAVTNVVVNNGDTQSMMSGMTDEKTNVDESMTDGASANDDDSLDLNSVASNSKSTDSYATFQIEGIKEWMEANGAGKEDAVAHLRHQYNKLRLTFDRSIAFLEEDTPNLQLEANSSSMRQGNDLSPTVLVKGAQILTAVNEIRNTELLQKEIDEVKATPTKTTDNSSATDNPPPVHHTEENETVDLAHKTVPPKNNNLVSPEVKSSSKEQSDSRNADKHPL